MITSANPVPRTVKCNQTIGNFCKDRVYFVEYFINKENKTFVKIQGFPGLHSPNIFEEDKGARVNKLFKALRTSGCNRKIYVSVRIRNPRDVVLTFADSVPHPTCKQLKIPKEELEKMPVGGLLIIGKDSTFCDKILPPNKDFSQIQCFFAKIDKDQIDFFDTSQFGTCIEI